MSTSVANLASEPCTWLHPVAFGSKPEEPCAPWLASPLARAMPKTVSKNAVEQAQNYQRRARELIQKSERKAVDALLAQYPHLAAAVLEHLATLGYKKDGDTGPVKETPSAFTTAMQLRDARMKQQKCEPLQLEDDPSVPQDDIIPSRYWTLGSLSVNLFMDKVLPSLEPISLSKANLKVLVARGDAVGNKAALSQLVEFMTGASCDFQLNGSFRRWSCLLKFLGESNVDKGRRAKELQLPHNWARVGICTLDIQGDSVAVTHNESKKKVDITDLVPAMVDKTALYIDFNWSDARVALAARGPQLMKPIPLACQFPCHVGGSGEPLAKRPRTQPAIMDGLVQGPGSQETGAAASSHMGSRSQAPAAPEEVVETPGPQEETLPAPAGDAAGLASASEADVTQAGLVESSPQGFAQTWDLTGETQQPFPSPKVCLETLVDDVDESQVEPPAV